MGMPPNQGPAGQGYPPPPQGQQPGYPPPPQGPGYPPAPGYAPPGAQGPGYQGYPPPPPPPPQAAPNRWGPTSVGIDANVGAGLSYIVPILGLIFFVVEKQNRFFRFHAAQAMLLGIASLVIWIPVNIIISVIEGSMLSTGNYSAYTGTAGLLGCIATLLALGLFAMWIIGAINAFTGKYFKLPVVGNIAENMAGGPPQPMF